MHGAAPNEVGHCKWRDGVGPDLNLVVACAPSQMLVISRKSNATSIACTPAHVWTRLHAAHRAAGGTVTGGVRGPALSSLCAHFFASWDRNVLVVTGTSAPPMGIARAAIARAGPCYHACCAPGGRLCSQALARTQQCQARDTVTPKVACVLDWTPPRSHCSLADAAAWRRRGCS